MVDEVNEESIPGRPERLSTCACCGAQWVATRESPKVDRMIIHETGKAPEQYELHLRCYEYIKTQTKLALASKDK